MTKPHDKDAVIERMAEAIKSMLNCSGYRKIAGTLDDYRLSYARQVAEAAYEAIQPIPDVQESND